MPTVRLLVLRVSSYAPAASSPVVVRRSWADRSGYGEATASMTLQPVSRRECQQLEGTNVTL